MIGLYASESSKSRPHGAYTALGLLDGVGQLGVRLWSRWRIFYGIQSLSSRKPSPRLCENKELNIVCPPYM